MIVNDGGFFLSSFKCVMTMAQVTSADVNKSSFGPVTSAPPMGNATRGSILAVDASMPFLQTDSIVSLLTRTVSIGHCFVSH